MTDSEVKKALDEGGPGRSSVRDTAKYQAYLKKYGITEDYLKQQLIRPSLLQTKIQRQAEGRSITVTDAQVQAYYDSQQGARSSRPTPARCTTS